MSGRSPGSKVGQGSRCLLILQRSLAIQLQKVGSGAPKTAPGGDPFNAPPSEYWMYDSGYLLFQGFLEANLKCFWNASLLEAMKLLQFQGYVAPGVLLVSSSACALEVVRAAWSRNVLKPPNNYVIAVVGDIDDCLIQPLPQGQFTPLPEALCWVILDLTSSGEPAVLEKIRTTLGATFPSIQKPSTEVVYDALAKLSADRKVYQTSQGYFVVTPERRRRDSSRDQRRHSRAGYVTHEPSNGGASESRQLLMSPEEALTLVHGEMSTTRDGDVTHQSVQTNLADVICGGNPNDKILYARVPRRGSGFPGRRLERRHSLRLFGSSKRLSSPSRGGSMRHIANKHFPTSDSSSSAEYPSTDSTTTTAPKKSSLLSRLFRRSKRAISVPPLATFSAQFPPAEWFNQRVVHLHSVGTQTNAADEHSMVGSLGRSQVSFATWTDDEGGFSSRAATLPRRHRRHESGSSIANQTVANSTPRTSRRHRSPSLHSSTLPRSSHSKIDTQSLCTSRNSVLPNLTPHGSTFSPCKSSATTLSSERTQSSKNSSNRKPSPIPSIDDGGFERSTYRGSYRNSGVYPSSPPDGDQLSPKIRRSVRSQHQSPASVSNGNVGNGSAGYQNVPNVEYRNSTRMSNSPLKQNGTLTSSISPNKVVGGNVSPGRVPGLQSRNGPRASVTKGQGSSTDVKSSSSPKNGQLISPTNKSSFTLQVSTSNRSSPTHSTPSANSVPKSVHSPARSYIVSSESPVTSTTTTTTTINGSNTKIFVQQQNSPVRSLITFENGLNKSKKDYDEILIFNETEKSDKENFLLNGTNENSCKRLRPKLERPTSLYSPREVIKTGFGFENKIKPEIVRRFPSVESLTCSDITITNSEDGRSNFSNYVNNSNHTRVDPVNGINTNCPQVGNNASQNSSNHHPNLQTPSTLTSNGKTMNNTRKLSNSGIASLSSGVGKDGLSYKNVFDNTLENPFGSKNNITSPDKTFDSTGSFNNLFNANLESENKLSSQDSRDFSSTKTLDELKDRVTSDLCTFPSLSDLTVSFKSIAAQKILQGISINSIDTLVEVNMAAAEKQNNCDVTVHTDFGLV